MNTSKSVLSTRISLTFTKIISCPLENSRFYRILLILQLPDKKECPGPNVLNFIQKIAMETKYLKGGWEGMGEEARRSVSMGYDEGLVLQRRTKLQ